MVDVKYLTIESTGALSLKHLDINKIRQTVLKGNIKCSEVQEELIISNLVNILACYSTVWYYFLHYSPGMQWMFL